MKRKFRNIISCFHDKVRRKASIYCFMRDLSTEDTHSAFQVLCPGKKLAQENMDSNRKSL